MKPTTPAWLTKARSIAARISSPAGKPCAAKKEGDTAKLYLYDAIGDDGWGSGITPQQVAEALDAAKGAKELEVYVNSPGGYVFDGIAIYNAIRRFDGKKTVYVDGLAASIASVIALAGDTVVTNEGGTWMIHDPWAGLYVAGTADEIEEAASKQAAALRKARDTILGIYQRATGASVDDLTAWMSAETWMSAAEARDRGFTDEVAEAPPLVEEDKAPVKPAAKITVSSAALADMARAQARILHERFGGASPSDAVPGQPGSTDHAGIPAKDQK